MPMSGNWLQRLLNRNADAKLSVIPAEEAEAEEEPRSTVESQVQESPGENHPDEESFGVPMLVRLDDLSQDPPVSVPDPSVPTGDEQLEESYDDGGSGDALHHAEPIDEAWAGAALTSTESIESTLASGRSDQEDASQQPASVIEPEPAHAELISESGEEATSVSDAAPTWEAQPLPTSEPVTAYFPSEKAKVDEGSGKVLEPWIEPAGFPQQEALAEDEPIEIPELPSHLVSAYGRERARPPRPTSYQELAARSASQPQPAAPEDAPLDSELTRNFVPQSRPDWPAAVTPISIVHGSDAAAARAAQAGSGREEADAAFFTPEAAMDDVRNISNNARSEAEAEQSMEGGPASSAGRWDPILPLRPSESAWRDSSGARAAAAAALRRAAQDPWNWAKDASPETSLDQNQRSADYRNPEFGAQAQRTQEQRSDSWADNRPPAQQPPPAPPAGEDEPILSRQWALLSRFQQAQGLAPVRKQSNPSDQDSATREQAKAKPPLGKRQG